MCSEHAAPAISPDLTVAELLRHYPQLDEPLGCLVPSFKALASPAVRDAVTRTLTLHQLAARGEVPLGSLITALREAAGIPAAASADESPAWVAGATRTVSLDARPMLAAGAHPVQDVMQALAGLAPGEVFELITPFVPAPLVDMARSRGFQTASRWDGAIVRTYFTPGV